MTECSNVGPDPVAAYDRQYIGEYNSVPEYRVFPVYSVNGGVSWGTGESDGSVNDTIGLTRFDNYKMLSNNSVLAVGELFDRSCDSCKPKYHRSAYFISNDSGLSWELKKLDVSDTPYMNEDYASFPDIGRLLAIEWASWDVIPLIYLSDNEGVTWDKSIQFNPKVGQWPYAWPWYTVYLGDGKMAAYIYDDLTLQPEGNTIPYYEAIIVSDNHGENWDETGYRSNVAGQSPGWPSPAPSQSALFFGMGVITTDPQTVQYVH